MASVAFFDAAKQQMNVVTKSKHTKQSAKHIVLMLLVYAFKEIIATKNVFSCLATGHRFYGGFFLFGPGACLFLLALLLNGSFWTSVTAWLLQRKNQLYQGVKKDSQSALDIRFHCIGLAGARFRQHKVLRLLPAWSGTFRCSRKREGEVHQGKSSIDDVMLRHIALRWSSW